MTDLSQLKKEMSNLKSSLEQSKESRDQAHKAFMDLADKFEIEMERGFSEEQDLPQEVKLNLEKIRFIKRNLIDTLNTNQKHAEKFCTDLEECYENLVNLVGL